MDNHNAQKRLSIAANELNKNSDGILKILRQNRLVLKMKDLVEIEERLFLCQSQARQGMAMAVIINCHIKA